MISFKSSVARWFAPAALAAATFCGTLGLSTTASAAEGGSADVSVEHRGEARAHGERGGFGGDRDDRRHYGKNDGRGERRGERGERGRGERGEGRGDRGARR